jgi:hypothetical protein
MTVRSLSFILATLLFGSMLRAEPDNKKPNKPDAGISISIHDGKVEVDGIQDMIDDQLDNAFDSIDLDNLPPPAREKLKEKLGKVRGTVKDRLKHMNVKDMDQFGHEMEKLGEDISKEMEGFGSDFSKQFGKKWGKQLSKSVHIDADDDDDIADVDVDDGADVSAAIGDLADLKLAQPQKDRIAKLRADSDKQVAAAKQALEAASKALHDQIANGKASDADIAKSIDAVTQQEAAIRKARILAWVHARSVLDDAQRKKVEGAAAKTKTK